MPGKRTKRELTMNDAALKGEGGRKKVVGRSYTRGTVQLPNSAATPRRSAGGALISLRLLQRTTSSKSATPWRHK